MSGDEVRIRTAKTAAASSDDLRGQLAELANHSGQINDAMTVVLCARMQIGQI